MRTTFTILMLIILGWPAAFAQISQGGEPVSFQYPQIKKQLPIEVMPAVDVDALKAEDEVIDKIKSIPWRFGQNIPVDLNMQNSGVWETLPNGDRLWRLQIQSAGALSINLTFGEFRIPPRAQMFIYNEDRSDIKGAFTSANHKPHGGLGVDVTRGEITIVEYYEPANAAFPGKLAIERVTHGYRDVIGYAKKGFGDSGSCNNNVRCPVGNPWDDQIRSVALILSNGNSVCTGALVNNTLEDGTPYFLTADHCLGGNTNNWVFRFNYESPDCSNTNGPTNQSVSGSMASYGHRAFD